MTDNISCDKQSFEEKFKRFINYLNISVELPKSDNIEEFLNKIIGII
jgi:hypothetical protein